MTPNLGLYCRNLMILCCVVQVLGWNPYAPPSTPIPCYNGMGPAALLPSGNLTYIVKINTDKPLLTPNYDSYVCASYLAICNDTTVDPEQQFDYAADCITPGVNNSVFANLWRWRYSVMTKSHCSALAAAAAAGKHPASQYGCPVGQLENCPAQHVKCCSTPYCNSPDPKLDPGAVPQPLPKGKLSCYLNVQKMVIEPAEGGGYTTPYQDWDSIPYVRAVTVNPTVRWPLASHSSAAVAASHGVDLDVACRRSKIHCEHDPISGNSLQANKPRGEHCTAEQMAAGDTLWHYDLLWVEDCLQSLVESANSTYHMSNVSCCTTDFCNAPDASIDSTTQVLNGATGSASTTGAGSATNTEPTSDGSGRDELMMCYVNVGEPFDPWGRAGDGTQNLDARLGAEGVVQAAVAVAFPLLVNWQEGYNDVFYKPRHDSLPGLVLKQTEEHAVCAKYRYNRCLDTFNIRYDGIRSWEGLGYSGVGTLNCSPDQAKIGVWEWAYRRVPVSVCEMLRLLPARGYNSVANISCCTAAGCNAPDREQDTQTLLPFDAPLPVASTITCFNNMTLGDRTLSDVPPAVFPISSPANRSVGNRFGELNPAVCYSMKVESQPGKWLWLYGAMPLTACFKTQRTAQIAGTAAKHVVCCVEELCNTPQPSLDAVTQMVNVSAPSAPIISCFTSSNTSQGLPAVRSVQYNSTVTTWQTPTVNTSNVNATNGSTFSQFSNATWNSTWNATGNSTTWKPSMEFSEPFVCASYKLGLCSPDGDCQGYESVPGVGSWAYYPLTLSQCYQMLWMSKQPSSPFQTVTCCSTDECNAPDETLDMDTQIIGRAQSIVSATQCPQGLYIAAKDPAGNPLQFHVSAWEATPFPGAQLAFVSITDVSNTTSTTAGGQQVGNPVTTSSQFMRWKSAVLPVQAAVYNPPAAWRIPAPFKMQVQEDGRCAVSSVPVSLFGGTVEFYVHVEPVANGEAWLEVWGVRHEDVQEAKAAGFFGARGYSRNVIKFITAVPTK